MHQDGLRQFVQPDVVAWRTPANTTVYGESESFNILGKLVLVYPVGGENITLQEPTTEIHWKAWNVTNMRIMYSMNAGAWTLIKNVADAGSQGQGVDTFEYWNLSMPTTVSNAVRIKINATANEAINATSANFSLFELFDITDPEGGGDVLVSSDIANINWTKRQANTTNVTLWFYNGTGSYVQLFGGNVTNNGTRQWQVPTDVISLGCKVKVQNPINADNWNESDPAFTIRGNITSITSPADEVEWDAGSTYPINWTYLGPIQNVTIQYSANESYGPWINLTNETLASNGTWNWTIASNTTLSTIAKIKVFDKTQTLSELSTGCFTVKGRITVDAPNTTGIYLKVGEPYTIEWTRYSVNKVNISYSNNSTGGPWKEIVNNINASNESYVWSQIPDDISNTVRVRISEVGGSYAIGTSTVDCAIIGKVLLTAPVSSDVWIVDSVRQINWTPTGNFTNVTINGTINGFTSNFSINTSVPAGLNGAPQVYNWTVGDYISDSVQIRVADGNSTRINLVNNTTAAFNIKGAINVTAPAVDETLYANQTYQYIQWNTNGTIGNVTLKLRYGGSNWYNISNSTCSGPGSSGKGESTYTWVLPDSIKNENCYVNITDESDSEVSAESAVFHVRPRINVTSPTLEQNIYVLSNNSELVRWNITGTTVTFVDIYYDIAGGGGGQSLLYSGRAYPPRRGNAAAAKAGHRPAPPHICGQ